MNAHTQSHESPLETNRVFFGNMLPWQLVAYASTLFHLDEAGTGVVPQADFLRTRGWFEYLAEDVEPW